MKYIIFIFVFLLSSTNIFAISDPLQVSNNKYGIHIADTNDLSKVAPLVNSNGGDWGYVTLVMRDNEKNPSLWQNLFDEMRRKHIIPIVRLATHSERDTWAIPQKDDAEDWARFLNSLRWPVKNRYVVVYNEPNHANEWGGQINPEQYAEIFRLTRTALKQKSEDFFVLPAALDVSASNTPFTLDALTYWNRIYSVYPNYFKDIDGWNSHSYPNPAFSASPYNSGRGSLRSYQWEINFAKTYGLNSSIPIFITETGWRHSNGKNIDRSYLSPDTVASNITNASIVAWNDPQIVTVTPFILNYQDDPFDHFSWQQIDSNTYYPFYESYKSIPKIAGAPIQDESYLTISPFLPKTLIKNSAYTFECIIKNIGQGIFDPKNGYTVTLESDPKGIIFAPFSTPTFEPNEQKTLSYTIQTPSNTGTYTIKAYISHANRKIQFVESELRIVPPPSMTVIAPFGWKRDAKISDVKILIYGQKDSLLHTFSHIQFNHNKAIIEELSSIVPGASYRIVLIAPGYLPRQQYSVLSGINTVIVMKRLLPFDINSDGKLSILDFWELLNTPLPRIASRFF